MNPYRRMLIEFIDAEEKIAHKVGAPYEDSRLDLIEQWKKRLTALDVDMKSHLVRELRAMGADL